MRRYLHLLVLLFAFTGNPGYIKAVDPKVTRVNRIPFNKYEDVSGYINITEIGGGFGLGEVAADYTAHFAGISTINGYVINRHFVTGLGLGINAYNGGLMAPVYLDLRYNFNERRFTPFIFGDGGILVNFEDGPGLFLNPGIGIYGKIKDKLGISLSSGLFVQRTPNLASFINVKLGVFFLGNGGEPCSFPSKRKK